MRKGIPTIDMYSFLLAARSKKHPKETGLGSAHNTVIWAFLSLEQYKIIQWPLSWSRILDAWESGILLGYGKLTADTINKWISVKYADFLRRNFMNTRFKTSYTISNAITSTNKGWMASPTRWAWVWANSRSWWWTGRPGMLQSIGSQRVRHDWVTELNWTELMRWELLLCPSLWTVYHKY